MTSSPIFDLGLRLQQVRTDRGLTQRELARRSGVPHALVSILERNKSSPSVETLRKILEGISMTMGEFFEPKEAPTRAPSPFFAATDLTDLTARFKRNIDSASRRLITLKQVGNAHALGLQVLHETYAPGADNGVTALRHASTTAGVVIKGELEVTVGHETRVLKSGESYIFDGRIPHRFRNLSKRPALIITASTPPYL